MNPLEEISKDLKKYIRSAKLNGRTVLCVIDVDRTYSNLEGYPYTLTSRNCFSMTRPMTWLNSS